ncbi:MAG: hypothetical protein ACFFC7_33115 [Candidatus Hermodarchaeota archaeon]
MSTSESAENKRKTIYGSIFLYTKQGYDLRDRIVKKSDGSTDVVQSLKNHQKLMKGARETLGGIIEVLQQHPNSYIDFNGDGGFIFVQGDEDVMRELINKKLVQEEHYEEEDEE